jgi:hypothetical protein
MSPRCLADQALGAENGKSCMRYIRHSFVVGIGHDLEQILETFRPTGATHYPHRPAIGASRPPGALKVLRQCAALTAADSG